MSYAFSLLFHKIAIPPHVLPPVVWSAISK